MTMLVKRNSNLFPSVPSFFDDFFTRDVFDWSNTNKAYGASLPAVNIKQNENSFEVEVAVPGLTKEDFKIELDKDVLTVSSEKENQNEENTEQYVKREFSYGAFKRTFSLPENKVDGDKIAAKYENGVLLIHLPIKEEAKPKPVRSIQVG